VGRLDDLDLSLKLSREEEARRVKVVETVCAEMERGMSAHGLEGSPVLEATI
jgi:hypothetical protein